ncbi:MAG TPA: aminomethyltransferase family protein, partial [Lysobacter sp.]|nr:aminomethyltransferase family protein [Lysobacter sp.]
MSSLPQFQLKHTPFHERTSNLSLPQNWRRWAGHIVVGSYDLHVEREYWAIRDAVAMIDVSPLMKYMIEGPDAARLLDKLVPRDIGKMAVGQVGYTGWCDDEGKLLDDGTISRLGDNTFRLTSAEPSLRWLSMNAVGLDVRVTEVTEKMGALSLQGPKSRTVLNKVCGKSLDKLKYFRVMENTLAGRKVTISRTGYTGDLGFEIWMDVADALPVWDALMEAGRDYGIVPCGILAMDMARVEAG